MRKTAIFFLILTVVVPLVAQDETKELMVPAIWSGDMVSIGLGMGLDYGGFGGNLTYYPVRGIGLFGGAGYALAGAGFNAGVKFRYVPEKYEAKVHPYVIAMYGYNAAVAITNRSDLNKLFYGPSLGAGIDFHRNHLRKGYWSFAVLVPFRKPEANEYIDMLESVYGVEFQSRLFPIAVSIGYKFIILSRPEIL
jgi:hypothetical protein